MMPAEQARVWRAFQADVRHQYRMVALTEDVISRAETFVIRHPLRALDAIHLACALSVPYDPRVGAIQFWTADRQQAAAARAEGLVVELIA